MTDMFDNLDPACVALAQAIMAGQQVPMTAETASCLEEVNNNLGYDAAFNAYVLNSERNPRYPYVDTAGCITIGKGHKIDTLAEFLSMPFYIDGENRPATDEEKRQAYYALKSYGKNNYVAEYYMNVTPLRLVDEYREALYQQDIFSRHHELNNGVVPNFDRMTAPMRRATMDVHFNAGMSQFPKARGFARELKKAEYCQSLHRLENNPNVRQRNEWTYNECMNGDFIR